MALFNGDAHDVLSDSVLRTPSSKLEHVVAGGIEVVPVPVPRNQGSFEVHNGDSKVAFTGVDLASDALKTDVDPTIPAAGTVIEPVTTSPDTLLIRHSDEEGYKSPYLSRRGLTTPASTTPATTTPTRKDSDYTPGETTTVPQGPEGPGPQENHPTTSTTQPETTTTSPLEDVGDWRMPSTTPTTQSTEVQINHGQNTGGEQ